jgi:pimeloyl-ACP methyl ester carboxylesterase
MSHLISRLLEGTRFLEDRSFRKPWGDIAWLHGYRLQEHVVTRDVRLVSPQQVVLASGREAECRAQLEQLAAAHHLPALSGRAIILAHGITRSSRCFATMARFLREPGVHVIGFDYPSTRCSISESASYLTRLLQSLQGIRQIDLVVHSMGGLLVRTYLHSQAENQDARLHRMVMLGVPNGGARMANVLARYAPFHWIFGPAGVQLTEDPAGYAVTLPTPEFEFAIIAGCRGTEQGWNRFLPGDDDGTVTVASTRLKGAADFMTVRSLHSMMMWNPTVMESTKRFLETGSLRASGEREPIL